MVADAGRRVGAGAGAEAGGGARAECALAALMGLVVAVDSASFCCEGVLVDAQVEGSSSETVTGFLRSSSSSRSSGAGF